MVLVDLATIAFTISIINTILIILISNKINFRLDKNDIITILTIVSQILQFIRTDPEEVKPLLDKIQILLEKLSK